MSPGSLNVRLTHMITVSQCFAGPIPFHNSFPSILVFDEKGNGPDIFVWEEEEPSIIDESLDIKEPFCMRKKGIFHHCLAASD